MEKKTETKRLRSSERKGREGKGRKGKLTGVGIVPYGTRVEVTLR